MLMLMVTFAGCQKLRDYMQPNVEVPNCQVVETYLNKIFPDETYHEIHQWVLYNDGGYPTAVNEYTADYDGHMRYVSEEASPILYDDHNRLIEEGSKIRSRRHRHRYIYEGDSPLPVRDTIYAGVTFGVFVEEFEYDAAGRITRVLRRHVEQGENGKTEPDLELRYYYDIRGNRQEHPSNPAYTGIIQYTDKPSLYSLNRVWQIMYRDFSRNATATAATYNEQGLPTKFADSTNTYFQPFLAVEPGTEVQYECE
jgi:hypothetical protein